MAAVNKIKIIQHNVLNWSTIRKNEVDNKYQEMYKYTTYQTNFTGEQHDGVAIAVKKKIKH